MFTPQQAPARPKHVIRTPPHIPAAPPAGRHHATEAMPRGHTDHEERGHIMTTATKGGRSASWPVRYFLDDDHRVDLSWHHEAACRPGSGVDPEIFQPVSTGGAAYEAQVRAAKAICARCPVQLRCLDDALRRIPHGIVGGATEQERSNLRRRAA